MKNGEAIHCKVRQLTAEKGSMLETQDALPGSLTRDM